MLPRAASSSHGTSAASAKRVHFGYKQNGGCVPPTLLAQTRSLLLFLWSPGMNQDLKGRCLPTQSINDNRWRPLTAFPLKILDNVSSSGSSTGIATSSHRGSTFGGLKFQTCTNILNKFFLTVTGRFGSPLIFLECGIFFIVP
jgi:hypothetical protein